MLVCALWCIVIGSLSWVGRRKENGTGKINGVNKPSSKIRENSLVLFESKW